MRTLRTLVALAVVTTALAVPPAVAQEDPGGIVPTSLAMTTPYPRVAVEAGDQASFALSIVTPDPTDVALEAMKCSVDQGVGIMRGK